MANVLFMVKATITDKSKEAAWNDWYNEKHCRQILESPGAIGARRLRAVLGEDNYQYITIYEFDSPESFNTFWTLKHRAMARDDYVATYGDVSQLGQHGAYEEIWHS